MLGISPGDLVLVVQVFDSCIAQILQAKDNTLSYF